MQQPFWISPIQMECRRTQLIMTVAELFATLWRALNASTIHSTLVDPTDFIWTKMIQMMCLHRATEFLHSPTK